MKKKIIWTTLTILVMLIIFSFSSENGEESSQTSGFIVNFLQFLSSWPNLEHFIRKCAHFSIYASLGFCSYLMFLSYGHSPKRCIVYGILFCFLYACSDEFHQSFVPERSAQFSDVLLDTCGATILIFICYLGIRKRRN